jgi:hypothetical protein
MYAGTRRITNGWLVRVGNWLSASACMCMAWRRRVDILFLRAAETRDTVDLEILWSTLQRKRRVNFVLRRHYDTKWQLEHDGPSSNTQSCRPGAER